MTDPDPDLAPRRLLAEGPVDDLFLSRWSPRSFSDTPVADDDIDAVLEAARWAPSCFGEEPWTILWVRQEDPDYPTFLGLLNESNRAWARRAPVLLFVFARTRFARNGEDNRWAAFDAGAAWMSIALQARMRGLYAHAMGGFDIPHAAERLGLPDSGLLALCAVAMGHRGPPELLSEAQQKVEMPRGRAPRAQRFHRGRGPLGGAA